MDLTGWLEFFVTGLAIQMREVQERGERVIRSDVLAQKHQLSERQRRLIGYLLEKSGVTIQEFEALYPKINRRTLQRELAGLIEKGLVVTEGATNQLRYILVKN
jgi:predicted HTH transcriptional regulator